MPPPLSRFIVIFRARISKLDDEYIVAASELRELALRDFGCLEFHSICEGNQEIALSYWPDEASILRWKQHADHVMAQRLGRERWYADYRVEITELKRGYESADSQAWQKTLGD
jgi:heme-degrading monooxygenase HmoA